MLVIVITIVLSIIGLILSLAFVGIMPSLIALILSIYCLIQKRSITRARALAMSVVGVILPVIMYLNSYGLSLPYPRTDGLSVVGGIIYDNYSNMGFDMEWLKNGLGKGNSELAMVEEELSDTASGEASSEDIYYVSDGVVTDSLGYKEKSDDEKSAGMADGSADDKTGQGLGTAQSSSGDGSLDTAQYNTEIFEKLEDATEEYEEKPISDKIGASDDDMPSYGGLPVGTLIIAQYFREDVHNCNPVLVLQNKTGKKCRYEARFIARDEDGEQLAESDRCVEVVDNDGKFVLEGRFDKNELGDNIPAMYEFSVSKRDPYEKNMADDVVVYAKENGNSVVLAAENLSDKKVKVDAFVLFFDKEELVDCIWLIPHNEGDVCITPGSVASISGDAYYRFDRIETYYTAYEAVGEQ
ncbi:hypothetical protein [Butyrivibrio sp. INlla21]|uniref:hypothetical protein n=1 Tax=Butyrivibrio sp. INlla21 TaxID=1520811 RepID=UPI0008F33843|nr:hypothetical protein [Butyrivibrio sp. INlla21]SFU60398.1 PS-10 peptidase S37 [Butyrivibrio sp. INlla21]